MAAFTTIAAGIGLAATAATTTASFVQAGKQKEAQRNAERDADEAMAAARKKLEVNFYDKLSIQKEPYELEREALLSQGAEAIQAGVESERGAAATAGRVQLAQQQGQAGIRSAMGQELAGLEKLSAQEEGRLRDVGVQLDLEEVSGAQLAAANAAELSAQATQQGFEGVTSMAQQISSFAPLYEQSQSAKQVKGIESVAGKDFGLSQTDIQKNIAALGTVDGVDFSGVSAMNPLQYKDFMGGVKADTLKKIKANLPNTLKSYRPNQYAIPSNQYQGYNAFSVPGF
jgi:hypothetical protein